MNSRIASFVYNNVLYVLPPEPPVFIDASRQYDATAVRWLLNECDVRPIHGEFVEADVIAKVNFTDNAATASA